LALDSIDIIDIPLECEARDSLAQEWALPHFSVGAYQN